MYVECFIGLGSNLADPQLQVTTAIEELAQLPESRLGGVSSLYRSVPMGPADQPDYINAVARLETRLDAHALLDALQAIEHRHQRVREGERWGPRTLDLDLLLYGQQHIHDDRLDVPHVGMGERNFVLYPLAELMTEDMLIPGLGSLAKLLPDCSAEGLEKIS
ncbi:MAG: 2-amino-4-hydroxy-6-hydroxymethyldihydropteridine diphosphokinase [Gammaproteobacteria bacterium]|nr:2-amino-4-hydroxy-6-hydroxymethyldihydropteridine diphosphokinase [Gammaproteobacteria bacterium]